MNLFGDAKLTRRWKRLSRSEKSGYLQSIVSNNARCSRRRESSSSQRGEVVGRAAKALADRISKISRISKSSSAKADVKPLNTQPAFGRFSISPKRWKRLRNSR